MPANSLPPSGGSSQPYCEYCRQTPCDRSRNGCRERELARYFRTAVAEIKRQKQTWREEWLRAPAAW